MGPMYQFFVSALYSTSHWGHHYVTSFLYVLIDYRIFEPWSHYLFFWHCYKHGHACLVHIHVTYSLYLTHCWEPILIQKPKSTMVQMRKHRFFTSLYTIPVILWCLFPIRWAPASHIRGKSVGQKTAQLALHSLNYIQTLFPYHFLSFFTSTPMVYPYSLSRCSKNI